jgi:hypothetical protein
MAATPRDKNYVPVAAGISSTDPTVVLPLKINPVTGRVLADVTGTGTWNVSQSGDSGSSGRMKVSAGADKTISDYAGGAGIVKSDANGVVSAASAGTDYLTPSGSGASLTGITASQVWAVATTEKWAVGWVATLDGAGKIPSTQLPSVAISEFLGNFADLTAALADAGVQASQRGDWFTITAGPATYIVITDNPTVAGDVKILSTPSDTVTSVNGNTGAVSLTTADIADSTNKRYVSDAQLVVIGNTSGTNSGNETASSIGSLVNAASAATPSDTDLFALAAAAGSALKLTYANLKTALKTYFDAVYAAIGAVTGSGLTMATGKLLGRSTASTGAIEEITVGTGLSLSGGTLSATASGSGAQYPEMYETTGTFFAGDLVQFWLPANATINEIKISATSIPTGADYVVYAKKNGTATDTISGTFSIATTDSLTNGKIVKSHTSFTGQITTANEYLTLGSSSACTLFPMNIRFVVKYTPA